MKTGLRMQSKNCCENLHERNICMWWPEAQNGVYHMDFLAEHWLSVGVGVFWLSMVLYGHYRGLVRIAVTLLALILSLVVTRVAMPCVTTALNHNTAIHQMVGESLLKMAGASWNGRNRCARWNRSTALVSEKYNRKFKASGTNEGGTAGK